MVADRSLAEELQMSVSETIGDDFVGASTVHTRKVVGDNGEEEENMLTHICR
jgi:hypothetical protein